MLKMCADRLLPVSYFEKSGVTGNKGITINISGVGTVSATEENTIDAEDVDFESRD